MVRRRSRRCRAEATLSLPLTRRHIIRSHLGQHGDAVRCYELALSTLRGAGGAAAAAASPSAPPCDSEHDLMAATARALYARGAKDMGAVLVMRVLRETNEKHPGALFEYGARNALAAMENAR